MFGYTLEEVKKIPGIDMIAPQSRELVKEKMASKYEGIYEAFGMKKDGTVFSIEIQAKETILNGQSIRIGAIRDLTEPKKLEEQNRKSDQLYRTLFEGITAGLSVINKEGRFLLGNKTACSHCGLSH